MPLGKSLDSLLTDYFGETKVNLKNSLSVKQIGMVVEVPVEKIIVSPFQTRTFFEPEKIQALAENIRKQGVLQPVIVLEVFSNPNNEPGYLLLAGERRLRAIKLLGLTHIPAIVKKADELDEKQQALISATENLQREGLSPLELAQTFKMLILTQSLNEADLAKTLAKTTQYVHNYLNLLTLSAKVKDSLAAKQITEGQARHLVGLDESLQGEVLNQILIKDLTVKEVAELVKQKKNPNPKQLANSTIHKLPAEIIHKADRFASQFPNSKLKCLGDINKGKIVISWGEEV